MARIEFGVKSELRLPDELATSNVGQPNIEPLDDLVSAMRAAWAEPLDYPGLGACVVPGDRVVLVLGEALVQPAALVAGTILELLDAGVEPETITVLRHATDAHLMRESPLRLLPEELQTHIQVIVHDAANREQLCMLNVSSHDSAIYLNRAIVEADVVIPFGVTRPAKSLGALGLAGVLYPAFADDATQQRFNSPKQARSTVARKQRLREAQEAYWFLGVRLVVQIIPGTGESLLHVVAGEARSVEKRSLDLCEAIWNCEVPRRAKLVVATLPGGKQQQSWTSFARVLDSAVRVVEEGGSIAVCCDLRSKPGPSLRRIARAESLDDARRIVAKDHTPDAIAAATLVKALQRARVYLLSRLDEERVEELGLAYVASADEVVRLVSHHESCVVLQNAQQAVPRLADEGVS